MKKVFYLLLLVFVGLTSCTKEDIRPKATSSTVYDSADVNPIGYNWELYAGRVFVQNLTDGSNFYYDHFGPNKNSSNLDIFQPSWLPFDIITKGSTNWKFNSSNQFILDNGSTYNYILNSNDVFNVYGLENGSQRNIEFLNSTQDYMNVKVYQSYGSDGVNNYSFYTVLTFVKVGFTGIPVLPNVPTNYTYNGVLGSNPTTTPSLVGTKWVVTKFIQNFVSTYPNDTLEFVSNTQYTINNSTPHTYNVSNIVGNNMKSLSLYSFTTLGGDWSGQVQGTFINDWAVNNSDFTNIMNTNSNVKIWMVRIQ